MTPGQLQQVRQKLNLSQVQLAQLLGVHPLTVSNWERGVLRRPLTRAPFSIRLQKLGGGARKTIGDEGGELLLTAGVVVALYALLNAAFGDDK